MTWLIAALQVGLAGLIIFYGRKIMADLSTVEAAVTRTEGVVDSAVVLINELAKEIRDTQPSQEALNALATRLEAKAQSLADAVAANPDPTP